MVNSIPCITQLFHGKDRLQSYDVIAVLLLSTFYDIHAMIKLPSNMFLRMYFHNKVFCDSIFSIIKDKIPSVLLSKAINQTNSTLNLCFLFHRNAWSPRSNFLIDLCVHLSPLFSKLEVFIVFLLFDVYYSFLYPCVQYTVVSIKVKTLLCLLYHIWITETFMFWWWKLGG